MGKLGHSNCSIPGGVSGLHARFALRTGKSPASRFRIESDWDHGGNCAGIRSIESLRMVESQAVLG